MRKKITRTYFEKDSNPNYLSIIRSPKSASDVNGLKRELLGYLKKTKGDVTLDFSHLDYAQRISSGVVFVYDAFLASLLHAQAIELEHGDCIRLRGIKSQSGLKKLIEAFRLTKLFAHPKRNNRKIRELTGYPA